MTVNCWLTSPGSSTAMCYATVDAIILEKKEDMKKRGLASPDLADALALTFAYPVAAHDHRWQLTGKPRHQYQYDPFQQAWSGRL